MNIHTIVSTLIVFSVLLISSPITTAQVEPGDPVQSQTQQQEEETQQEGIQTGPPGIPTDIESVLDPQDFFDQTFDFFRQQPAIQDAEDRVTQEGAFDETNEKIGERIGVNPVEILKAFVRAIIWVLESGIGFFSQLVN